METKKLIRAKFGPYFLIFYIITFLIFFIFPKQLVSNIYVLILFMIANFIFVYLINRFKKKRAEK
jgi:hypothetical protein